MSCITIKGIYRDKLMGPNSRLLFDSGWKPNLIVLRCRQLLAGFMKNETVMGIQFLKVGQGDPAWDTAGTPPAAASATDLVDTASAFVIPNTDLTLQFLDTSDAIVTGPTNRLEIVATLGPGQPTPASDPPYPLREFGLFGSFRLPGTTTDTPFMIDYIRHPLIEKDGSVTLERRVRLIF